MCVREGEREGGRGVGRGSLLLCHLMRSFEHLHEEGVDGRVTNQLEKEQVLQTLEPDGPQRW